MHIQRFKIKIQNTSVEMYQNTKYCGRKYKYYILEIYQIHVKLASELSLLLSGSILNAKDILVCATA